MKSNHDHKEKDGKIVISNITVIILLIASLIIFIVFIIVPSIYSMQIKYLSKSPKNIKDNGCLLYSTKSGKYGEDTFYVNQQNSTPINYIIVKGSPFKKKFNRLIHEINIPYDEFKKIHTKECIKVRYVDHEFLGTYGDDIYDLQ